MFLIDLYGTTETLYRSKYSGTPRYRLPDTFMIQYYVMSVHRTKLKLQFWPVIYLSVPMQIHPQMSGQLLLALMLRIRGPNLAHEMRGTSLIWSTHLPDWKVPQNKSQFKSTQSINLL